MKYRRVAKFPSVAAAEAVIRCAYGLALPHFDRAEIFQSENRDGVLRIFRAAETRHYRIEHDGAGGWVFLGGALLLNTKELDAASG
jgi:hypothetical protein